MSNSGLVGLHRSGGPKARWAGTERKSGKMERAKSLCELGWRNGFQDEMKLGLQN
jgi:hypothetical protein